MVSGMNTFGEYVMRVPYAASRTARARDISSSSGAASSSCDIGAPYPMRVPKQNPVDNGHRVIESQGLTQSVDDVVAKNGGRVQ